MPRRLPRRMQCARAAMARQMAASHFLDFAPPLQRREYRENRRENTTFPARRHDKPAFKNFLSLQLLGVKD